MLATRHRMPLLAMTHQLSVVLRVLPSRRERLCFTTWMSVLKPRAAPSTLSQIHQRTQSGLLLKRCKPVHMASDPAVITGRPPLQGRPQCAVHRVEAGWILNILTSPALHAAQGLLCPES